MGGGLSPSQTNWEVGKMNLYMSYIALQEVLDYLRDSEEYEAASEEENPREYLIKLVEQALGI